MCNGFALAFRAFVDVTTVTKHFHILLLCYFVILGSFMLVLSTLLRKENNHEKNTINMGNALRRGGGS